MSGKQKHFTASRYDVTDSIGYLLGRSRLKLVKSVDLALADSGITGQQGAILMLLAQGRYRTAADISREMFMDSASTTRIVDRLVKRGLLQRHPCEHDRRVVMLELTEAGQALVGALPDRYAKVMNREFGHFSSEEIHALKDLLRKFLQDENKQ